MATHLRSRRGHRTIRLSAATGMLLSTLTFLAAGVRYEAPPRDVIIGVQPVALPAAMGRRIDEHAADPVRLRVPAIDVDAPVGPLRVDGNGVLPPPDGYERAGWWLDGPEPGERGPAVIAGHLDSHQGPAVFFRLAELDVGDRVLVDRADGTTAAFAVGRIEQHDKHAFPTEAVYGDTTDAQLRLITCGGDFDHADRRYLDNVIVYATRIT